MAKSHLVQYFLEVEDQYLEMVANLSEMRELAAKNLVDNNDLAQMVSEVDRLKENYSRIGYIMFLLNKPNKKSKTLTQDELSWYKALSYASKEAILDENRDVLCKLKELIREGKLKNES